MLEDFALVLAGFVAGAVGFWIGYDYGHRARVSYDREKGIVHFYKAPKKGQSVVVVVQGDRRREWQ